MERTDLYNQINYFKSCSELFLQSSNLSEEVFKTKLYDSIEYVGNIDVQMFRKSFEEHFGRLQLYVNEEANLNCDNDDIKELLLKSMVLINAGDLVFNKLLEPIINCCCLDINTYMYLAHTYRFLHGFEKASLNAVDSFYWVLNNCNSNLYKVYNSYLKGVVNKAITYGNSSVLIALFNITRFCQMNELRDELLNNLSILAKDNSIVRSVLKEYYSFYEE